MAEIDIFDAVKDNRYRIDSENEWVDSQGQSYLFLPALLLRVVPNGQGWAATAQCLTAAGSDGQKVDMSAGQTREEAKERAIQLGFSVLKWQEFSMKLSMENLERLSRQNEKAITDGEPGI